MSFRRNQDPGPGQLKQLKYPLTDPVAEARLIEQAAADPAGFAPLYESYLPRIYAYCLRRVGSPEEAEDLTSLIFTRALSGLAGFRGGSVAAWLFKIAHNTVANHRRDRQPYVSADHTAWAGQVLDLAEPAENALDKIVRQEDLQLVVSLIAALPEEQRELLALIVAGRLTAKETGAVLGKSEAAIRMALHRLLQQLKTAYRQSQDHGPLVAGKNGNSGASSKFVEETARPEESL